MDITKLDRQIMRMQLRNTITSLALAAVLLGTPTYGAPAKDSNLDLARQLNEAFVSVADQASASVVVVKVAQKPGRMQFQLPEGSPFSDEDNPFFDQFRRFFEQQQERQQQPRRQQQQPHRQREPH